MIRILALYFLALTKLYIVKNILNFKIIVGFVKNFPTSCLEIIVTVKLCVEKKEGCIDVHQKCPWFSHSYQLALFSMVERKEPVHIGIWRGGGMWIQFLLFC